MSTDCPRTQQDEAKVFPSLKNEVLHKEIAGYVIAAHNLENNHMSRQIQANLDH